MQTKKQIRIFVMILLLMVVSAACALPEALDFKTIFESLAQPTIASTCEPCPPCTDVESIVNTQLAQLPTSVVMIPVTVTPMPTATSLPQQMPTPTNIPQATAAAYQFMLQYGSPAYLPNVHHLDQGDAWMGVGGQVFGADGLPLEYVVVRVQGALNGKPLDLLSMTGVADHYGPAGYEIQLSNGGVDSVNSVSITLYDLMGNQISDKVLFSTSANADQRQIVINFVVR